MKKKILFSILAVMFILPCLFLASACSKNKDDEVDNNAVVFATYVGAFNNFKNSKTSLTIKEEQYENYEQIGAPLYLPSYVYTYTYDAENNQAVCYVDKTWLDEHIAEIVVRKVGNQHYMNEYTTSYIVGDDYARSRVMYQVAPILENNEYVLAESYLDNLDNVLKIKQNFYNGIYDGQTVKQSIFNISGKINNDGTNEIEYHSKTEVENNDGYYCSNNMEERIVTVTFTNQDILSIKNIWRSSYYVEEDGQCTYSTQQENTYITTFTKEFDAETFNKVNFDELSTPTTKIQQDFKIYRDGSNYATYVLEFGIPISDFVASINSKEGCAGHDCYLDENFTKPLTNEKTLSFGATKIYLLSIPDSSHALVWNDYVNRTAGGKETKLHFTVEIVEIVREYQYYNPDSTILKANQKHYPSIFTTKYYNGEDITGSTTYIEGGQRYFLKNVNQETGRKSRVNVYIDGVYYETLTNYDTTTLAHYIYEQYIENNSLGGTSLTDERLKTVLVNASNITVHDFMQVGEEYNLYIITSARSGYTIFKFIDVSKGNKFDRVAISIYNNSSYLYIEKDTFVSLKINGVDYLQTNYYSSKNNRVALPYYSGTSYIIEIEYVPEE